MTSLYCIIQTCVFVLDSNTTDDQQDILSQSNVAKIVISLIICILGLIGNLVAIFVILVLKEYQKSVTHW